MYVETKTDPYNVYADAFYEESHGYANEDHERQTTQDAETEDFGSYRYETNWDVLLKRMKVSFVKFPALV